METIKVKEETCTSPMQELVMAMLKLEKIYYAEQCDAIRVENSYPNATSTGMTLKQKVAYLDEITAQGPQIYPSVIKDNAEHVLVDVPTIGVAKGEDLAECLGMLYVLGFAKFANRIISTPLSSFSAWDKMRGLSWLKFMGAPLSAIERFEQLEVIEPETKQGSSLGFYIVSFVVVLFFAALFMAKGLNPDPLHTWVHAFVTLVSAMISVGIVRCAWYCCHN